MGKKQERHKYMSIALAATFFQVSPQGLRKRVNTGAIRFLKEPSRGKFGFRYLVYIEDVMDFFSRRDTIV